MFGISHTTIIIAISSLLAALVGWMLHTFYIRWYLKKHLPKHPEYRFYQEILYGNPKKQEDKKDKVSEK